jgi:hypothetical protein
MTAQKAQDAGGEEPDELARLIHKVRRNGEGEAQSRSERDR